MTSQYDSFTDELEKIAGLWSRLFGAKPPAPAWLKGVASKSDAKKAFHRQAFQNHPDRGGATEAMQEINDAWSKFKASPAFSKLAMAYMRRWC